MIGNAAQTEAINAPHPTSEQLEDAFALFNNLSVKLADSYSELEQQVARLSVELADANSERIRELTEKERLAQRLETLLDSLPAGVIVVDEHDCIRQANPLARDMLGDAIEGMSWQQLAQQAILTQHNELRLRDGRWVSVSVRALQGDSDKLVLLADVTETRALQDKLAQQQRLSSLGEMVASLAHQLRTPLTTALLYLSTLEHPNTPDADRQRFVDKAKQRLLHLERMVNDMLMFARGDVIAAENINAATLLQKLFDTVRQQCDAAGVALHVSIETGGAEIQASEDALLSALQNLADNAIEACRHAPQGELRIEATADETRLQICFIDNGCGMSEAVMNRVLEPFFTTRPAGTGLGLAVVNAAVERFHGSLNIASTLGKGSRFDITLPLAQADALLSSDIAVYASDEFNRHRATANPASIAIKR